MTQLKQYIPYVLILILAYFCFDLYRENKALEKSADKLEQSHLRQITANDSLINEINETELLRIKDRKASSEKILALLKTIDSLQKKRYDPEIDLIPDTDIVQLERIFSKYYPK